MVRVRTGHLAKAAGASTAVDVLVAADEAATDVVDALAGRLVVLADLANHP
jgi:hypothetical protein